MIFCDKCKKWVEDENHNCVRPEPTKKKRSYKKRKRRW